jgi:serine protease Do
MKLGPALPVLLFTLSFAMTAAGQDRPGQTSPNDSSILEQYDQAIDKVAERAMQSVVRIEVTGFGTPERDSDKDQNQNQDQDQDQQTLERQRSIGSGVIVDPDGYIVTNNHVVQGALRIRVILAPATVELMIGNTRLASPQHVYEAKLIGTNRYADLAVIKINATGLPYIPLPESFHVHLGQTVIAIGAPEGLDHTVTKGIVSAAGRQPELDRPMVYVQTDAPINPGNSGGPLVDRDGNLIGICTFIYTSGGGSEGLGFAIPEPVVRFAYNELKQHGIVRRVTIGAHAQTITAPLAAGLNLPQDWGVIITDVDDGRPGALAGLQPGDIVKTIDGLPIDSLPKYTALLYMHKRGSPLHMSVLRKGNPVTLSITAVDEPPAVDSLSDLINPKKDLVQALGIFVIDLDDSLADAMPSLRSKHGVIVAGMLSEEPATLADLQVGDVVRSVNGKKVANTDGFRRSLAGFNPGDPVVLEVERQSVMMYVAFEME